MYEAKTPSKETMKFTPDKQQRKKEKKQDFKTCVKPLLVIRPRNYIMPEESN